MPEAIKPTQGSEAKTGEAETTEGEHHEKHPQHPHHPHHHHHDPRIIHPASSGTSHLDPGAVVIKP